MTSPTKRLAILLPELAGGGAQRSMLKLAGGVARLGYPVDLVVGRAAGPFLAEVPREVRLVDLCAPRVAASLPALVYYLRRQQPFVMLSVLHTNLIAIWARRLAGVSTRLVVSERNTLSREAQHFKHDLRARVMPRLVSWFYPWADDVVAVSTGVAQDLVNVEKIPSQKVHVLYNPIVTPEFELKVHANLEHAWFRAGEPPVVLAVGRLSAQKGFDILVRAFAWVLPHTPARLLIIGEGEERPRLQALVNGLGLKDSVSLPGFIDNPYPYMLRAGVFVLSSRWEGLPGVLIEAMYCGPRLVSTDCPSGAREILADGRYGRLTPVDDKLALSQAILAALRGEFSPPPPESWRRFESETVLNQYIHLLFNEGPGQSHAGEA